MKVIFIDKIFEIKGMDEWIGQYLTICKLVHVNQLYNLLMCELFKIKTCFSTMLKMIDQYPYLKKSNYINTNKKAKITVFSLSNKCLQFFLV